MVLIGVYLGYAVIQALGGLFLATTTADGSQAPWLIITTSTLNVVLLTAAAATNPHLLRRLFQARQPDLGSQENRAGQDLRD